MYGIGYWLTKHTQLHPNRIALVTPERTYTYGELNREVNRVARTLRITRLWSASKMHSSHAITPTSLRARCRTPSTSSSPVRGTHCAKCLTISFLDFWQNTRQ